MSTSTNRRIKRLATKSDTRSNKPIGVTQATVRADFAEFIKKGEETDAAKSVLRRDALRLTIADASLVIEWTRQWDIYKSTATGKAAETARKDAKLYFMDWFGIQRSSDPKSDIAKRAQSLGTRAVEIAQECVAVHKCKYGDGFDFANDGKTYLTRGTRLAEDMWKHMEYDKIDSITGSEYAKRYPSITVHDRVNQVHPGHTSWADVRSLILEKTGQTSSGKKKADVATIDATQPHVGLKLYADTAKANASAYASASNKVKTLDDVTAILKVAFNSPMFTPGWESVEKGFALWRNELKAKPLDTKVPSLADAKGADVLQMFKRSGDVKSPEAAKTLPHPNGPSAKAKATAKAK